MTAIVVFSCKELHCAAAWTSAWRNASGCCGNYDLLQPLTSQELDQLEDFLLSDVHGKKSITLDMLDGFLASLAVGPSLVLPGEWMPMVFDVEGQAEPVFASQEGPRG